MSTQRNGARSLLATLVGYLLVALIVLFVFHFIIGTILWLFKTLVVVVVLLALLSIYLRLKSPD
jgi:hypothetical protein